METAGAFIKQHKAAEADYKAPHAACQFPKFDTIRALTVDNIVHATVFASSQFPSAFIMARLSKKKSSPSPQLASSAPRTLSRTLAECFQKTTEAPHAPRCRQGSRY